MDWTFKVLDDNGDVVNSIKANEDGVIPQEETDVVETTQELLEQEVVEQEVAQQQENIAEELSTETSTQVPVEEEVVVNDEVEALKAKIAELESAKDVLKNNDTTELPEDVAKFLEYKKETGRGFEDYLNLQKDWSAIGENDLLHQYYKETKPHLDDEDIQFLIDKNFSYDEEFGDDAEIKEKKVALKEELFKAKSHFEGMKEKYKAPLESRGVDVPEDYKKAYDFYSEYNKSSQEEQKLIEERAKIFAERTNQLFNEEFKGFEFNLGEKKQVFTPKDVSKVKDFQSDISNFLAQHLDENGIVKDAAAYHKAIFAATNADAMANYFYEQGRADATDGIVKETKNIDMSVKDNKVVDNGSGIKFRTLDSSSDFKLRFK